MLCSIALTQDSLVVVSASKYKVAYRGVPNYIQIGFSMMNSVDYTIHCRGGEVTNLDTSGALLPNHNFILIPGNSMNTYLSIYNVSDTTNPVLLEEVKFYNFDLPPPTLFVSSAMPGDHIYNQRYLFAKYPASVMLDYRFQILDWLVSIDNRVYKGEGSILSQELIDQIVLLEDDELIRIETNTIGPDRIKRKIEGEFLRAPAEWYEEN